MQMSNGQVCDWFEISPESISGFPGIVYDPELGDSPYTVEMWSLMSSSLEAIMYDRKADFENATIDMLYDPLTLEMIASISFPDGSSYNYLWSCTAAPEPKGSHLKWALPVVLGAAGGTVGYTMGKDSRKGSMYGVIGALFGVGLGVAVPTLMNKNLSGVFMTNRRRIPAQIGYRPTCGSC